MQLDYNCQNTFCHSNARCISSAAFSGLKLSREFCHCDTPTTGLYGDGCLSWASTGDKCWAESNSTVLVIGIFLILLASIICLVVGYSLGRKRNLTKYGEKPILIAKSNSVLDTSRNQTENSGTGNDQNYGSLAVNNRHSMFNGRASAVSNSPDEKINIVAVKAAGSAKASPTSNLGYARLSPNLLNTNVIASHKNIQNLEEMTKSISSERTALLQVKRNQVRTKSQNSLDSNLLRDLNKSHNPSYHVDLFTPDSGFGAGGSGNFLKVASDVPNLNIRKSTGMLNRSSTNLNVIKIIETPEESS